MSKPHDSSHLHVTGKSEFVDDRIPLKNELFIDVFYSSKAHARIQRLDFKKALEDSEVIAILTGNDFHLNRWGTIFQDQPILAVNEVQYAGEPIVAIVAKTREAARRAKSQIEIEYQELPAILTIEEAKKHGSFISEPRFIERGEVKKTLKESPHTLQGKLTIQGQDHFYLESQASVVYPLEDGQLEVHTSSQHPTETQHVIAHALGISDKDVICQVKRMGGAFGGKESQGAPFAAIAALAARKLNSPARLCLTKDDDMIITGKRNPFENHYTVGFTSEGKILALELELYSDAGAYADLSTSIMERAMLHCDNAYFIPNMKVRGQVCRTNHHSHTAFRGFGGPKGVATIELIIEKIAHALKKDPLEVRTINLYTDAENRNTTHYGQIVKNNCLRPLFQTLKKSADYSARRKKINEFNQSNDQFLKGLSLTPVKFGISFTTRFLNQANALVIIHQDGTIQISTGATEMGQGVNARISELVTSELGLPRERARVMPTRTDKNANTSPTAASAGTDLNGAAALLAARKIKNRLSELALQLLEIPKESWASKTAGLGTTLEVSLKSPELHLNDSNEGTDWTSGIAQYHQIIFENESAYFLKKPTHKISFKELVREAYLNRISLTDYAFYRIPDIHFNKLTGTGDPFLYFTQGVACSEVTVNWDSGETKVDRVDILMDLGRPINQALDYGQITGGFIQGMGWVTTENLFYNSEGLLLSHAPSTYKIPNIQDTPRDFRIALLENTENRVNIRGTKAVGEPPLLLGISVWTAIGNALSYLHTSYPELKLPATNEVILRALSPKAFEKWDGK